VKKKPPGHAPPPPRHHHLNKERGLSPVEAPPWRRRWSPAGPGQWAGVGKNFSGFPVVWMVVIGGLESWLPMPMPRCVEPEILDHLPTADPEAQAGRRDLRRVNFVMGNERWILRTVRRFPQAAAKGVVELGAGEGQLAGALVREFPGAGVTAIDLAPRPSDLDPAVIWRAGDIFGEFPAPRGGVLVANLFLHHFEGEELRRIGQFCENFEVLVFSEPDRTRLAQLLGTLACPFVNRVTRHDMMVSIRAGFFRGELAAMLGLDSRVWRLSETSTWRGGRRVLGLRC